jgi:aspartyl-tRNA(Asn)/glutamyl-tRNA(Gln) amidotransferase subunit C
VIDRQIVVQTARLARLHIDEAAIEDVATDLDAILSYVERLQALDLSEVEPTTHPVPISGRMRTDVVKDSLSLTEVLQSAPSIADGAFLVPGDEDE